MEFGILGPVEIRVDGRPIPLGGPKQRALLATLLLHRGHVVPAERLIDDLWGGLPPDAARNLLWVQIARLRKVLDPGRAKGASGSLLVTRAHGYLLETGPGELDLERFERLVTQGRDALASGDAERAGRLLRQALDLWRGPALADLAAEPFAQGHVVSLEERRLSALEDLIDADLAAGRHQDLAGELEALIAAHPLRERLRGQLMLALYRAGRQADALEVYRRTQHHLAEELGIDPGAALQRLEQAVLTHDPALEWAPPVVPHPDVAGPAAPSPPGEERRAVTVVTMSILPTRDGRDLDPESLGQLQGDYLDAVRTIVAFHGGSVQRVDAETVLAVFGVPTLHDNDPLRAVRAAAEVRSALERTSAHLQRTRHVRLSFTAALETGEVLVRYGESGGPAIIGATVRLARKLEHTAAGGELLLGPNTYDLVRDAVTVQETAPSARDATGIPARAWRLVSLRPDAAGRVRHLDAPMVGRDRELALVVQTFERAVSDRSCQLVTVLGPAGIGKTRLVREFLALTGERAAGLHGRCLDYGKGITFWPIVEVVREAIGAVDANTPEQVRARVTELLGDRHGTSTAVESILGLLGLAEQAPPVEELPLAVRRLFGALARRRPLVIVLDDLHLAEPPLLELLEDVADLVRDGPLLLCCIARTELFDVRPNWGGGKPNATTILLEPLGSQECGELIENLLGTEDVDVEAKRRLPEIAEGNPLFIEELIAMLIDNDVLVPSAGSWVAKTDLGKVPIPPTISALLSARLERLESEERALLSLASVMGTLFSERAVRELAAERTRAAVGRKLTALTRKELIRPHHSDLFGDTAFDFRHALIRDAAYGALSKRERSELHERFAGWLEATAPDRPGEVDDVVAYHLEQACQYRAALGLEDPALIRRAVDRLVAAGQRAGDRWDHPAAVGLLERARALLPAAEPAGLELLPALVANLGLQGDLSAATDLATRGIERARTLHERRVEARLRIEQMLIEQMVAGGVASWSASGARPEVRRAIQLFERAGDARGLGAAWYLVGRIEWVSLRCTAMEAAVKRAIEYFRSVGSYGRMLFALEFLSFAYFYGPVSVSEAIRRCEHLIHDTGGNRAVRAVIQGSIACMEAMRNDFRRAWGLLDEVLAVLEEFGQVIGWMPWAIYHENVAFIARLEGDYPRMEASLRNILDPATLADPSVMLASDVAWLAEAVDEQGRHAEAAELLTVSEHLATAGDLLSQLFWRRAKSRALAREGRLEPALELSGAAVSLAEQTDALNEQADAWMARAKVLRLAGFDLEAKRALLSAVERYRRKGNVVSEAQAQALLSGG